MRRVGLVLFDGFEVLDAFGPVQLLGIARDVFEVVTIGPASRGLVRSAQGIEVAAQHGYADAPPLDILLVPGGQGARQAVHDEVLLSWLRARADDAEIVASVCTGAALLAAAGLLEGYRATTNKFAYAWATSHGETVEWVPQARWVHDRDRWTSSGVAAGMDMTAALVRHLHGDELAEATAFFSELELHREADWDPFAERHGLI